MKQLSYATRKFFAKLSAETKITTAVFFLSDSSLFIQEEKDYLIDFIKKNRKVILEKCITEENITALEQCLSIMKTVKTLYDECFDIAEKLNKKHINAFLLNYKSKK